MKRNEYLYDMAEFFMNNNQIVHITLISGKWVNGTIISVDRENRRLMLDEEKEGMIPILFERIKEDGIEKRRLPNGL